MIGTHLCLNADVTGTELSSHLLFLIRCYRCPINFIFLGYILLDTVYKENSLVHFFRLGKMQESLWLHGPLRDGCTHPWSGGGLRTSHTLVGVHITYDGKEEFNQENDIEFHPSLLVTRMLLFFQVNLQKKKSL